jgi:hypothetical protein
MTALKFQLVIDMKELLWARLQDTQSGQRKVVSMIMEQSYQDHAQVMSWGYISLHD